VALVPNALEIVRGRVLGDSGVRGELSEGCGMSITAERLVKIREAINDGIDLTPSIYLELVAEIARLRERIAMKDDPTNNDGSAEWDPK
jgi:hypothetical protein